MIAALILPALMLYRLTNEWSSGFAGHAILIFPIDHWIPFSKVFVLPYYFWYLQLLTGIFWLVFTRRSGRLIYHYTTAILLALAVSSLVFVIYPTHVPRPDVVGDDILARMVRLIYEIDHPYNCFPSLHVALAVLTAYALYRIGPQRVWFYLLNGVTLILIVLSTVLTKQHYTPDILGGLAVAGMCWLAAGRLFSGRLEHLPCGRTETG